MSEIAGGGGSGGGGEAAVLSLKINTGTAATELATINTALDRLAMRRDAQAVVTPDQLKNVQQLQSQVAQLSNALQKATVENEKFKKGFDGVETIATKFSKVGRSASEASIAINAALGGNISSRLSVLSKGVDDFGNSFRVSSGAMRAFATVVDDFGNTLANRVNPAVLGVDKSLKTLALTSAQATRILAQPASGAVAQFEAISNAARGSADNVKKAVAALTLAPGASNGLREYYAELQKVTGSLKDFQKVSLSSTANISQFALLKQKVTEVSAEIERTTKLQRELLTGSALGSTTQLALLKQRVTEVSAEMDKAAKLQRELLTGSALGNNSQLALLKQRVTEVSTELERAAKLQRDLLTGSALGNNSQMALLKQRVTEVSAELERASKLQRELLTGSALGSNSQMALLKQRVTEVSAELDRAAKLQRNLMTGSALGNNSQMALMKQRVAEVSAELERAAKLQRNLMTGSALGNNTQLALLKQRVAEAAATAKAGEAAKQHAAHVNALNIAQGVLHSTLRGVSGVLGGLWLTYAKFVPVLLAVAAATKTVKDSFSAGLEVNFMSTFVAALETSGKQSIAEMKTLRDSIAAGVIEKSRDSVFNTQENAQALQKLALAGIESARGLELLNVASQAAVFGQTSLANATGMVLDTLYNFNLASYDSNIMADNFSRVADIMTYTAATVNASFEDLARAFQNITGVAGTFNIEIEEASVLLQSLAEAGIRGQKAGTYVRNFLDDVLGAPVSRKAEAKFQELGVERFDPNDYGQYGASQYIDTLVKKIKELGFIEQQDAIRAITNQRSRRVLRQEIINSYDKESQMLVRVQKLAENAKGALTDMSAVLTNSGRYSLIMAQSAYNASVTSAYQNNDVDSTFQDVGSTLKGTFNSKEFQQVVDSLVGMMAKAAKAASEFFATMIANKDTIATAFNIAAVNIGLALLTPTLTKVVAGMSAMSIGAFTLSGAMTSVAVASRAAWAAMVTNPVGAIVTALGVAATAWLIYKQNKEAALSSSGGADVVKRQIADLQKYLEFAEKRAAEAGPNAKYFWTGEVDKIKAELRELTPALQAAVVEDLKAKTDSLAVEIKSFADSTQLALDRVREDIMSSELESSVKQVNLYAGFYTSLESTVKKAEEFNNRLKELYSERDTLLAQKLPTGEVDGKIKATRQELAKLGDLVIAVRDQMEDIVSAEAWTSFSAGFAKMFGKNIKEVSETIDDLEKQVQDLRFGEGGKENYMLIMAEKAKAYNLELAAMARQQAATAESGSSLQARAADLASVFGFQAQEAGRGVDALNALAEAKRVAAGTDYWSLDTLMGFTPDQMSAMIKSLGDSTTALNSTKDSVRALTLQTIDAAAVQFQFKISLAAPEDVAGLQQQLALVAELRSKTVENFAAIDAAAARDKAGRGGGGPGRSAIDAVSEALQKAKTDIEEFKNAYQEAMAGIGERASNFEIGPLEAHALSVSKVSEAYGEMLAVIDKAKEIPNLKGSQSEKLDTDRAKLVGEQNKELAKLNQERIESAWDLAAELQKAEIATGNLVLGAAEAWLMDFGATYGEAIAKTKRDWDFNVQQLASTEVLLNFAVEGGSSAEEIARLKAEVERLKKAVEASQGSLDKFKASADLGSWAVGLKEDLEKGERALAKFAREVEKAGEASEKGGLFGMLFQGTTAKFNDAASRNIAAIRGEISKLQTEMAGKPFNLEFQGKLEGLERELETALANTAPAVQTWSDNFGSAIANAIVYGFEEGESPAKQFANMLKQELARSLTQVFSQNFTVMFNMVGNMLGGGKSGGGVEGAANGASGIMDTLGNLKTGWDYASKGLNWLTGASAAAPAFAVAPIASAFAPATTIAGGLAGGVGTTAFSAGTSALVAAPATSLGTAAVGSTVGAGAAAGGGIMAGIGAAMPWIAGGLLLASAFGLFDKKPSNKAAGGTVDLESGKTTTWEMQGDKAPDQTTKDARDGFLAGLGAFSDLTKATGTVALDIGGRDGIQAAFNGGEMKSYGADPDKAMLVFLDEIVKSATIDPKTVAQWQVMQTAIDGTTRSAADSVDVMGLLTSGVGETDIERAQIIKASNESLGQSYAKLAAIMGINESASDQWRQRQHALQDGFSDIGLSMPATIDGFRELANSIDLTTEDGRKLYNQLMGLGPAFLEAASAIEQTMDAISGVGKDSIESIKRSVMTDAEEYAYNDSQLVVGREKYAELIDPASIQANFDKNMELINASWSLIPEEIKKSLVPQFETIINDETRLANERLSLVDPGYAPVVTEPDKGVVEGGDVADRISASIEAALTKAAAGFSAAGDKQGAAAATFAAAAASIPARIVVQSNVTVSASEIGR